MSSSGRWIDKKSHRLFRKRKLGNGCMARIFRRYPRTYAIVVGIVPPLWLLICLSMVFGWGLGELEGPHELDANDAAMRAQARVAAFDDAAGELIQNLPTLCFLLHQNSTLDPTYSLEYLNGAFNSILSREESLDDLIERTRAYYFLTNAQVSLNMTTFPTFMKECGDHATELTDKTRSAWFGNLSEVSSGDASSLSFHWNRCVNRSNIEFRSFFQPTRQDIMDAHPDEQGRVYRAAWRSNQQELEAQYQDELEDLNITYINVQLGDANATFTADNTESFNAQLVTTNQSITDATGRDACHVNIPAAAWFWFTVMTTVGYGNQAPVTWGGRLMIYTFGFVSILLFGSILAATGTITSHLVHDVVVRSRIRFLARKQVMMLVWGILWIMWLLVLGNYMRQVSLYRLRDDLTLAWEDAIWFAFISTTTVGLGDFYPAPEVVFPADLIFLSLSFLFGFVLLSSFLAELSQLVAQYVPDISEELGKRLKYVGCSKYCLSGERESMDDKSEQSGHDTSGQPTATPS